MNIILELLIGYDNTLYNSINRLSKMRFDHLRFFDITVRKDDKLYMYKKGCLWKVDYGSGNYKTYKDGILYSYDELPSVYTDTKIKWSNLSKQARDDIRTYYKITMTANSTMYHYLPLLRIPNNLPTKVEFEGRVLACIYFEYFIIEKIRFKKNKVYATINNTTFKVDWWTDEKIKLPSLNISYNQKHKALHMLSIYREMELDELMGYFYLTNQSTY